ncbi:hypothetical protein Tco_0652558 [Tanacetum coccineum]|uniref:Retrovirus-related Pol polyprotein from transposon TNT 1-94 n=1 Tax=Tanacetum coccineum TaxID=301880 RepID=A0ABQ4WXY7_9ASTR
MATKPKLDADLSGETVDQTDYRSKIGSLMYLTSSRPDIVQEVCYCARTVLQCYSAKAEFVALSASCAQVMWMRTQLQDYGFNYNKIPLYCDSQSAMAISCNPVQHSVPSISILALPEERFQLFSFRSIGMRYLTLAELEVRMPTKIELTLEQSQQGVSNDVLARNGVNTYAVRNHNGDCFDIEDDIMDQ